MKVKQVWQKEVSNEKGTKGIAEDLATRLDIGDTVLMYGDLGAGKTFLVREICRIYDVESDVSSPTFTIVNQYGGNIPVNHLDLYRVETPRDMANLGLSDILNMDSVNFVEWPQKLETLIVWPHYRLHIDMQSGQKNWRQFILEKWHD